MEQQIETRALLALIRERLAGVKGTRTQLAAQRDGIERRLHELAAEIEELNAALTVLSELLGLPADEESTPTVGLFDDIPYGTIAEMSRDLIERNQGPMKVADLTRALEALGKMTPTNGRGNYGTVYGTLKRSPGFVQTGTGEFELAERVASDRTTSPMEEQVAATA